MKHSNHGKHVGGSFTTIDGETRDLLTAFDAATGALAFGWNPKWNGGTNGSVPALTVT